MRYLVARRLLSDLSVLVCQLHPFCTAAADAATTKYSPKTTTPPATNETVEKPQPNALGVNMQGRLTSRNSSSASQSPPSHTVVRPGPGPPMMSTDTGTATAEKRHSSISRSPGSPSSVASPPLLVLRRKTTNADPNRSSKRRPLPSPPSSAQLPPPPPPPPLIQVAARIAELVEAIASHPILVGCAISTTATAAGAADAGASLPAQSSSIGEASSAAAAPAASRREKSLCRGGLVAIPRPDSTLPPESGSLSLSPWSREFAGDSRAWPPSSGMPGALGSLVSLLAAMVGAEVNYGSDQRPQGPLSNSGVEERTDGSEALRCDEPAAVKATTSATVPRPSRATSSPALTGPLEATLGAKAVSAAMATATAAATTTTIPPAQTPPNLSDGVIRLASMVIRAANRACLLDLVAVQVGCSSCHPLRDGGYMWALRRASICLGMGVLPVDK